MNSEPDLPVLTELINTETAQAESAPLLQAPSSPELDANIEAQIDAILERHRQQIKNEIIELLMHSKA